MPVFKTPNLQSINVFAEVRGKYARPPIHNNPSTDKLLITKTQNPLLSRPSTAGSLRRRSTSLKKNIANPLPEENFSVASSSKIYKNRYRKVENDDEKEIKRSNKSEIIKKEKDYEQQKILKNKEDKDEYINFDEELRKDELVQDIDSYKAEDKGEEDSEKNHEEEYDKNNEEDLKSDCKSDVKSYKSDVKSRKSQSTNKTKSHNSESYSITQQRYISELESLLRHEKLKRIKIEQSLLKMKIKQEHKSINS